jgi:hypothetical protein
VNKAGQAMQVSGPAAGLKVAFGQARQFPKSPV